MRRWRARGCPFAQDALVGNIAAGPLIAVLKELGAELPEHQRPLDGLVSATLGRDFAGSMAGRYSRRRLFKECWRGCGTGYKDDSGEVRLRGFRTIQKSNRPERRNAMTPEIPRREFDFGVYGRAGHVTSCRSGGAGRGGEAFCAGRLDVVGAEGYGGTRGWRIRFPRNSGTEHARGCGTAGAVVSVVA